MAGFSAIPALDVNPIGFGAANTAAMLSNANQAQEYQARQQLLPGQIADQQAEYAQKSQLRPLELKGAQQQSDLKSIDYANDTLAQVAKNAQAADPDDAPTVWDEGMKAAAAKGVTQASQYISHYRPDLAERIGDVYGSRAGGGGGGKAAATAAGPAGDPAAIARAVAQLPPEKLQTSLRNLNAAIQGFNRVKDADTWNAELDTLRNSGMAVDQFLPNQDWNPLNFAAAHSIIQKLTPVRDAMAMRAASMQMGLPAVQPPPQYEPQSTYVGIDRDTGQPVYHDVHGGPDTMGANAIAPKPSAGMATFMLKQSAYLQSHPGDDAGALEFANGKKNLSPAQMMQSATDLANKQLADETLAGATIPDPDSWVKQKKAEIYKSLSTAEAPAAPNRSAPAPAALPARALDALKKANGQPIRFNNGQSWRMGPNGKPVRVS